MRSILVGTDFSSRSERAVRRAGLLAASFDAALSLVHVVDDDQPARLVATARTEAERQLDELLIGTRELQGLSVRAEVRIGDPFLAIGEAAAAHAADLIVLGAHRRQLLRDVFIGTTLERVIRTSARPVLMVNVVPAGRYLRTLVAVDLSDASAQALRSAEVLGLLRDSAVLVLHAFEIMLGSGLAKAGASEDAIAGQQAQAARNAARVVEEFVRSVLPETVRRDIEVREGTAALAIKDTALALHVDLVVVGTHGRGGISKLLLGSVTEQVLREVQQDILVVPPRSRARGVAFGA